MDPDALADDLKPLFDAIVNHLPPPQVAVNVQHSSWSPPEHSAYVGKIAVGRLSSGSLRTGQAIVHINAEGEMTPASVGQVSYRNLKRESVDNVQAGNIVAISGVEDVGIGDTACSEQPIALPPIKVEEPTVRMVFKVNDSPFSGREGRFVTSREIRKRLFDELESNVAMRVEDTERSGEFVVSGRGELHLAILIETMRREGYELAVSKPEVIFRQDKDGVQEPIERVFIEVLNEFRARKRNVGQAKGRLQDLRHGEDGTVYVEFLVPTRGILGFRQPLSKRHARHGHL